MSKPNPIEIDNVFYTTPRDGYKRGILWIKREEEEELDSLLIDKGVSICIDGPTGTGKSSLAITTLKKRKVKFLMIQVTKNMTWEGFCRKLLKAKVNENISLDLGVDTGIDKGLPIFKLHFGFKTDSISKDDIEYENLILKRMTDDSICEILYKEKLTLLIDDFERANKEIFKNVAEMCKLMTQSYISSKCRLVIVGTDDIYKRLTDFNRSLDARLKEISLGTINKTNASWLFLLDGFDKLKLKHPVYELNNKIGNTNKDDIKECNIACYEAADGLLKSLNELGKEIAREATTARRISKTTILKVSERYLNRNIKRFNQKYPILSKVIEKNSYTKSVVIYLFKHGIGRIHNITDIGNSIDNGKNPEQVENAIMELTQIEFLTKTGHNGEIVFVTNPNLAHTLGVALMNPKKYNVPSSFVKENEQLVLPLLQNNN